MTTTTETSNDIATFTAKKETWRTFRALSMFRSTDIYRPILTGIGVRPEPDTNQITFTATDSYTLMQWKTEMVWPSHFPDVAPIMPGELLTAMWNCKYGEHTISYHPDVDEWHLDVRALAGARPEVTYRYHSVQGDPPNARGLIPTGDTKFDEYEVAFNPDYLARIAAALKLVTADNDPIVQQMSVDALKPWRFYPKNHPNITALLMPVRIT